MTKEKRAQIVTLAFLGLALLFIVGRQSGWDLTAVGDLSLGEAQAPAEPRETIYRMLEAARDGDVATYLSCYSGQMERMLTKTRDEMTRDRFAEYLMERNAEIKGVAINEPEEISNREVRIRVEYVYEDRNEAQQFSLQKVEDEWKIARVTGAERVETLVPYGTPVY